MLLTLFALLVFGLWLEETPEEIAEEHRESLTPEGRKAMDQLQPEYQQGDEAPQYVPDTEPVYTLG